MKQKGENWNAPSEIISTHCFVHCMVPCLKRGLCTVIFDHYKALSVPQAINNVGRNAPNYAPKDNRLLLHEIT